MTTKLEYLVYAGTKRIGGTFRTALGAFKRYKKGGTGIWKRYTDETGHVCLVKWL